MTPRTASPDGSPSAAGFSGLGLDPRVITALAALGYEEPTPIQAEAIPPLVEGRDLLGQAATGTGKTAAFALPILQRLADAERRGRPMAVVLVPTRELAIQVSEAIFRYGRAIGARVVALYGGQPIFRQLQQLSQGVDIVVGTPGRVQDHLQRSSLDVDAVGVVVLDEADEMLDMGFAEDIEAILGRMPKERQTVLFSATMPPRIESIARQHQRNPKRIRIAAAAPAEGEAPRVRQVAYVVPRSHKPAALGRVLDIEAPTAALVFCRTRVEVDQLTDTLIARGYRAEALHGGMSQEQRDKVMSRLRSGAAELLIATDVAARGLDVDVLTHVVNYDVPSAPESYVHRIGRVGRAGREGVAITLAEPRERRQLGNIERLTRQPITVEPVPSVADLRARQMELTLSALRVALDAGDDELDPFRTAVRSLRNEFDELDVAAAALRLVHEANGSAADEPDIPDLSASRPERGGGGGKDRDNRSASDGGPTGKLYIALGKHHRIRPADLVGAIANETHLSGKQIGPIFVSEKYSIVGVPDASVDEVIAALQRSTIKGKRPEIRRFVEGGGNPRQPHRPFDRKHKGNAKR